MDHGLNGRAQGTQVDHFMTCSSISLCFQAQDLGGLPFCRRCEGEAPTGCMYRHALRFFEFLFPFFSSIHKRFDNSSIGYYFLLNHNEWVSKFLNTPYFFKKKKMQKFRH
jgi:hypothetical protein